MGQPKGLGNGAKRQQRLQPRGFRHGRRAYRCVGFYCGQHAVDHLLDADGHTNFPTSERRVETACLQHLRRFVTIGFALSDFVPKRLTGFPRAYIGHQSHEVPEEMRRRRSVSKRHVVFAPRRRDEIGDDFFGARMFKLDIKLVALDPHHIAIAKFLVKHPVALRK